MRLIDAENVAKNLTAMKESLGVDAISIDAMIDGLLNKEPTIDAEPVRHGRWEPCTLEDGKDMVANGYKRCSLCHDVGVLHEDAYGYWNGQTLTDYCPSCGAKMDAADIHVPAREDSEEEET